MDILPAIMVFCVVIAIILYILHFCGAIIITTLSMTFRQNINNKEMIGEPWLTSVAKLKHYVEVHEPTVDMVDWLTDNVKNLLIYGNLTWILTTQIDMNVDKDKPFNPSNYIKCKVYFWRELDAVAFKLRWL